MLVLSVGGRGPKACRSRVSLWLPVKVYSAVLTGRDLESQQTKSCPGDGSVRQLPDMGGSCAVVARWTLKCVASELTRRAFLSWSCQRHRSGLRVIHSFSYTQLHALGLIFGFFASLDRRLILYVIYPTCGEGTNSLIHADRSCEQHLKQ